MKSRILFLLLLGISFSQSISAQLFVGAKEAATLNSTGSFSPQQIAQFQSTTTVFILQYEDYVQQLQFEKAIKAVWTITPFIIAKPEEIEKYLDGKYSIFSFSGYKTIARGRNGNNEMIHYIYSLWLPTKGNKGKMKEQPYCKIFMNCDFDSYKAVLGMQRQKEFSQKLLSYAYNEAVFYNWGPGFLQGYLKTINDLLLAGESRGPYSGIADKGALKALQNDTLYVPDYVNLKFNALSGGEKIDEDADDLPTDYRFPVKMVSAKQLNEMIINSDRPLKYLIYTRSNTDKYVSVYDAQKGMIYNDYTPLSYNFKNKDYKKLADKIKER